MQSTITTDASYTETLSLSAAKQHLAIGTDEFDGQVDAATASAIDWCERYTGRTLRAAVTRRDTFRLWHEVVEPFDCLPVISVSAVKYRDTDDAEQTVDAADWRLLASSDHGARLELAATFSPPQLFDRGDAVVREYTTGYASAADIPPAALQGIKAMLLVFFGDLTPAELKQWEAAAKNALSIVRQGVYQ